MAAVVQDKNLDIELLRAVAIILTIVAHFVVIVPTWAPWLTYFWLGGGVDLFFAISGFLITGILVRSPRRASLLEFAYPFWRRRVYRLLPAALFWSVTALLVGSLLTGHGVFGEPSVRLASWLAAVLNVENLFVYSCVNGIFPQGVGNCAGTGIFHYWSLSLEEQFYLLVPFAIWLLAGRLRWLLCATLVTALFIIATPRAYPDFLWFFRTDALLLGSAIALAWHQFPLMMRPLLSFNRWIGAALLTTACAMVVLLARQDWSQYFTGLVAVSGSAAVLIASPNRRFLTSAGVVAAAASYVGSRSYSLYLVHQIVFHVFRALSLAYGVSTAEPSNATLIAVAAVAVSFALAEFSYRFIENPMRRLGARRAERNQVATALS